MDIQSQIGASEQQCTDSQQSVAIEGPGTITVQLVDGAEVVVSLN